MLHVEAPSALDRVVKKCLAKEPDDRWHAAKDLCDELKWIAEGARCFAHDFNRVESAALRGNSDNED